MPQADISVDETAWVQLTASDATTIRVQNLAGNAVALQATATGTAPSDSAGRLVLAGELVVADEIAALWPGVADGKRVWARAENPVTPNAILLSVSHD